MLSQKQYKQERLLILTGEFGENKTSITVSPLSTDKKLLKADAFLPSEIHKEIIPIDANGDFWHLGSLLSELVSITRKKIPTKEDFFLISKGQIPMLIRSYYASKGETYLDTSLYMLEIRITVSDKKFEEPIIKFTNLFFIQRMDDNSFFKQEYIDNMQKKMEKNSEGIHIPSKTIQ